MLKGRSIIFPSVIREDVGLLTVKLHCMEDTVR